MSDKPIDNKAQLGCGTLIIIALIVMVFSGGSDSKKLQRQLDDLSGKIDRLETKVDELSQRLSRQPASAPAPPERR